jgi:hypothetical protein
MSFTTNLTNQTFTENGAYAYKSSNSAVLDLFSMGITSEDKKDLILNALGEDTVLAIKTILYSRDVRAGMGNRDIFTAFFDVVDVKSNIDLVAKVINHLPDIGYWKDLVNLLTKSVILDTIILQRIKQGLEDKDNLCAKWMPRQGHKASIIAKYLNLSRGDYRRYIVSLSSTVEQQMCANEWERIEYSKVPSIANRKYSTAFFRHDEARRQQFLNDALAGKAKMNSSVLYPHQIIRLRQTSVDTANALWSQLPNYMEKAVNVLPIIDTSGSMYTQAIGTEGSCLDVALGLGLYFAEHNTGTYKDLWMNFSNSPKAYYLEGETLAERINNLDFDNWGMSTDINKAMEFVLKAAKDNPKDTPKMILIVSDMSFNSCTHYTNYEYFKKQFKEAGVEMPSIVFWRVNVNLDKVQPITKDEKNTILINGYSPSILKSLLNLDIANYNPYTAMLELLNPLYKWLEE